MTWWSWLVQAGEAYAIPKKHGARLFGEHKCLKSARLRSAALGDSPIEGFL